MVRSSLDFKEFEWEADVSFNAGLEAVMEYARLAEEQKWPKCDYSDLPDQPGNGIVCGRVWIPFASKGCFQEICWQLLRLSEEAKFMEVADTNGEDFKFKADKNARDEGLDLD